MDMRTAFPSKYIKAADLNGDALKVKIRDVQMEDLNGDHKPVVYFEKAEKGLVLNKTNSEAIAADLGWNSDNWVGAVVELFPAKTQFNGSMVDTIRVRVPRQKPATATIAPNARARAEMGVAGPPTPPVAAYDDDDLDEIPF